MLNCCVSSGSAKAALYGFCMGLDLPFVLSPETHIAHQFSGKVMAQLLVTDENGRKALWVSHKLGKLSTTGLLAP